MQVGRPATELKVTMADRTQLESIARSQSLPASLSRRAQIVLRLADGETNSCLRVESSEPPDGVDVAHPICGTRTGRIVQRDEVWSAA
jgi:hypothetical protein